MPWRVGRAGGFIKIMKNASQREPAGRAELSGARKLHALRVLQLQRPKSNLKWRRKERMDHLDQSRTPIIDALQRFADKNQGYFNIPGHRGEKGVDAHLLALLGAQAFAADRTETDGLDDLHAAEGVIREAQDLAAELFGSDHCRFVVNGTTGANEAMILAAVRPGEKILVPRNAHKSVMMGLVMSGAVPVWIMPERERETNTYEIVRQDAGLHETTLKDAGLHETTLQDAGLHETTLQDAGLHETALQNIGMHETAEKETGLYGAVDPEKVKKILDCDPDIRAVFLVNPTYYGSCSDLKAIAEIAHAHDIPLLVDEAHGAHFTFHEDLPASAILSGADLVAQSTHKTIGSLTQSAMLHISGRRVSLSRVDDALKLVQSTSPSYLLMASLDGQRHLMAEQGHALQSRAMHLAELLRSELKQIPGIEVYHDPVRKKTAAGIAKEFCVKNEPAENARKGGGAYDPAEKAYERAEVYDPCRVVFSPCAAGLTGLALQEKLFRHQITTELADLQFLVLVVTHGNTEEEIMRLSAEVREIVLETAKNPGTGPETAEQPGTGPKATENPEETGRPEAGIAEVQIPAMVMSPRDAWFAEKEAVPLQEACGRIAGEAVTPYPPGIPLVYPGELLSENLCRRLALLRRRGIPVHDAADHTLASIRVVNPVEEFIAASEM